MKSYNIVKTIVGVIVDKISSCCFVGHRNVSETTKVKEIVWRVVENLVTVEGVRVFRFGSNSEFDNICFAVVSLQNIMV